MAFGFTPKFEQTLELNDLQPKKHLAIALETIKTLKWNLGYASKSGIVAYTGSGIFTSSEEFKLVIRENTAFIVSTLLSNGMYDWGKNKRNIEDFIQRFDTISAGLSEEQLATMIADFDAVSTSDEEDELGLPPPTAQDNLKGFLSFFIPRTGYAVTPVIIDITMFIFIIMAIAGAGIFLPDSNVMLRWGANFRPFTLNGQWWRLITNVFLHFGILHLLFNMYALLYVGLLLEPFLGKTRFLLAYFFTGVIASITSLYWHPLTISAGASGAIFGMYGVFLAMLTTNVIDKALRKSLLTSIGVFVIFNLANGLKAGIDNAAHIGGLISGLIIGYVYYPGIKNPERTNLKYITLGAAGLVFLVISFGIYNKIPDDVVVYNTKMEGFAGEEEKALALFSLPQETPPEQLITAVDSGLLHWNRSLKFIEEAGKLDIPEELSSRLIPIKKYCVLRIKSYKFIQLSIKENNARYGDSIKVYGGKIEAALNEIKGAN